MRVKHHGDLENIYMALAELEGSFPLWDDPFGGPPEPTLIQWRADQFRHIETVFNHDLVMQYFQYRWMLNAEKVRYHILSDQLSEINLTNKEKQDLKFKAQITMFTIEELKNVLISVEKDKKLQTAINKISELRHQGKILKFSEWMRT